VRYRGRERYGNVLWMWMWEEGVSEREREMEAMSCWLRIKKRKLLY
jgi:hypothetical protein